MNKPVSALSLQPSPQLDPRSPGLEALLNHIAEGASERERERVLPFEAIDLIRQARLGALRLPTEAGGAGSSIRELFEIVIRLGEADANVAHILRNHFSVVEWLVRRPGDDQHRRWQKAVADGAIIGLAATELETPKVGDVKPNTTLTPDGNGDYLLNGTKYYSTGTLYSDYVLVRAADTSGATGATLIPVKREGIELIDDWDGLGQRLTATGTTHFRNVRVKRQEVVFDAPDVGYGIPYSNTFAQLFLTAINAGIARAILRDAAALVRSRQRTFYYAPTEIPTDDPLLQQTVGQIASGAFAAETVVLAAADALDVATDAFDAGDPNAVEAAHKAALLSAKAKIVADEFAICGGSLSAAHPPPRRSPISIVTGAMRGHCLRTIRQPTKRARSGNTKSMARRCRSRASFDERAAPALHSETRWRATRTTEMGKADIHLVSGADEVEHQFRSVMRRLAGGVSIITAGRGDDITGMTVTSLASLSATPPRLLVSINRQASSFALIERYRSFGVNILGSDQQELAGRFSNGKLKGKQRFEGTGWSIGLSGVPLLENSLATVECQVEEIIERHSHGIVVGSLMSFDLSHRLSGLVYWNGQYIEIDHDTDLDLLAEVSIPLAHVR
jgi:alkylation response protein AidB-like acyl-CoA dehydrogenase/flavin reductase (DIM6/NTAB) family NADH-FMN oxidoreductase RutF